MTANTTVERTCSGCEKGYHRRKKESVRRFVKRKYCTRSCAYKFRSPGGPVPVPSPIIEHLCMRSVSVVLCTGMRGVLVDTVDVPLVKDYRWYIHGSAKWGYYAGSSYSGRCFIHLHRLLYPDAKLIDHKDGNGLNNLRRNLRPATHQQNCMNQRPKTGHQYRGVYRRKKRDGTLAERWTARAAITVGGKYVRHELGTFAAIEEAARAYDKKAVELFGEFARLNFPLECQQ